MSKIKQVGAGIAAFFSIFMFFFGMVGLTSAQYAVPTCNSATLHGTVTPNGSSTEAWFEWGSTSGLGHSTSHQTFDSNSDFEEAITGLSENSTYYYRAMASNDNGTATGATISFTTSSCGGGGSFVNFNFIVTSNCGPAISGASVSINQNFGNGTSRTTDGSGFANIGVLGNTNISWSASASGFSSDSGSRNSDGGTTVNVTLNKNGGCSVYSTPYAYPTPASNYTTPYASPYASPYAYPTPAYPYPTPAPIYPSPYATPYATPYPSPYTYPTPYAYPTPGNTYTSPYTYPTPYPSPYATPYPTPYPSPYPSPYATPYPTPYHYPSPYSTPYPTPYHYPTPYNTYNYPTPYQSPYPSPYQSPYITPYITPYQVPYTYPTPLTIYTYPTPVTRSLSSRVIVSTSLDRNQAIQPTLDNNRPHPGDEINYTVNYQNVGNASVTNLVLQVDLPYEVDYLYSTPTNPNISGNTLIFNLGTLRAGGKGTVTIRVRVRENIPDGTNLNFPALLTYIDANGNPQTATANVTAQVVNENSTNSSQIGANVFGAGFLPHNIFGWLLLIMLVLILIILARYLVEQFKRPAVVYHNDNLHGGGPSYH